MPAACVFLRGDRVEVVCWVMMCDGRVMVVPCPGCLRKFSSFACTATSWRAAADSVPIELTSECQACGVGTCNSCAVCRSCLDSAQPHDDTSADDDDDEAWYVVQQVIAKAGGAPAHGIACADRTTCGYHAVARTVPSTASPSSTPPPCTETAEEAWYVVQQVIAKAGGAPAHGIACADRTTCGYHAVSRTVPSTASPSSTPPPRTETAEAQQRVAGLIKDNGMKDHKAGQLYPATPSTQGVFLRTGTIQLVGAAKFVVKFRIPAVSREPGQGPA